MCYAACTRDFSHALNNLQAIAGNSSRCLRLLRFFGEISLVLIFRTLFKSCSTKGLFPLASTERLLPSSCGMLEFKCHPMLTRTSEVQAVAYSCHCLKCLGCAHASQTLWCDSLMPFVLLFHYFSGTKIHLFIPFLPLFLVIFLIVLFCFFCYCCCCCFFGIESLELVSDKGTFNL